VVHDAPARGHRHRARLAIRGRAANPRIGLFQAGTHRIVATPDCAVHHPALNAAAAALREAIRETGIAPYVDASHRGTLRYVQLVLERPSGAVQVVLVGRGESPECLGALPEALAARLGDGLQGLFFNAQPDRTNAILGAKTVLLAGRPAVCERLGGVEVFFPPTAFGQNHLPLFERALERIHRLVPARARVAELYCGVGAIGLGLLARGATVAFNERAPGGLEGLALGLAARPAPERARASRFDGAAGERAEIVADAEVVVVDPPRRGLDAPLLDALVATPPARLVYLACDQTSLARDLERLLAGGRLAPGGVEAFDFFPFTDHVETLVWLDRTA
jgi:tRNA/tmRNA/rRNA uracil-C5-methylase (TrmA/RlmC/RlmD family)